MLYDLLVPKLLVGGGQNAPAVVQSGLSAKALWQPKELTLQAFCKALDGGLTTTSFVNIWWGADGPFKFLDKLKATLDKQIDNLTTREILLKQLPVENANPNCQKVLQPLRAPTVIEMLKACQGISTAGHFAVGGSRQN